MMRDRFVTHLAIWDAAAESAAAETTWEEPVTDDDYQRARPR
ncbi:MULTISPECIES: hypothetical protein [unclassified Pseudofrankia]|nr:MULTISPECIES: hypothetical protein [unclassified Pseudofrankia]MDT3442148.1 hypothetical protein [Pseudofrankia sp. BMG5.37]